MDQEHPHVDDMRLRALSARQLEVLRLVIDGSSNRQIARHLGISPSTVKRHLADIFGRLGVHSRVAAVGRALTLGILAIDDDLWSSEERIS